MTKQNNALKERLSQSSELTITVTGRKSGRPISIPIWFALVGDTLYLLPVHGSDSQWYKNVLADPKIRIDAGGARTETTITPLTNHQEVESVVNKFRRKYGAGDVKKYYSKLDTAVVVHL